MKIIETGDAVEKAYEEKAPNYICENAFEIASAFNKFYNETRILTESDNVKRASWLSLLKLTKNILFTELNILGIDVPDRI